MERMPSKTYELYKALYRYAPFGEDRADLRIANMTAWLVGAANVNIKSPSSDPREYQLRFDRRSRRKRERDLGAKIDALPKG